MRYDLMTGFDWPTQFLILLLKPWPYSPYHVIHRVNEIKIHSVDSFKNFLAKA